jgi:asparagine synthetase B (glutamine-hydrolysing)
MDTTDPLITFDEKGHCSNCNSALELAQRIWFPDKRGEKKLHELFEKVKHEGKGKEYDCIIGLSGGVDSSYLAYLSVKNGLRPLVVHVDCGWNSEMAVIVTEIVARAESP